MTETVAIPLGSKLSCEIQLMDEVRSCTTTPLGEIYAMTKSDPCGIYSYKPACKPNKTTELAHPAQAEGFNSNTDRKTKASKESVTSLELNVGNSMKCIQRDALDRYEIKSQQGVLGLEASEDGSMLFGISEKDGSVCAWAFCDLGMEPVYLKKFSPSDRIATSVVGDLLISVMKDKIENQICLEIYNQNSSVMSTALLPDQICKVYDIIWQKNDEIFICYETVKDGQYRHCVSKLIRGRTDCTVTETYEDLLHGEAYALNDIYSMAWDEQDKILYVSDKVNGRIIALTGQLIFNKVVLDRTYDKIQTPSSIHYLHITKQLVVVDRNIVKLFEVKVKKKQVELKNVRGRHSSEKLSPQHNNEVLNDEERNKQLLPNKFRSEQHLAGHLGSDQQQFPGHFGNEQPFAAEQQQDQKCWFKSKLKPRRILNRLRSMLSLKSDSSENSTNADAECSVKSKLKPSILRRFRFRFHGNNSGSSSSSDEEVHGGSSVDLQYRSLPFDLNLRND